MGHIITLIKGEVTVNRIKIWRDLIAQVGINLKLKLQILIVEVVSGAKLY